MPTITRSQLRDQLFHLRGATPCTIVAVTYPKLVGGMKCPLVGMTKWSRVNAMINWNYENAVNRQREREDLKANFVALERSWGQRLHDAVKLANGNNRMLPLVAKDWEDDVITEEQLKALPVDELYLECKPEDGNWVSGMVKTIPGMVFQAKIFASGSSFGIKKGRISKLALYETLADGNSKFAYNYDRGNDLNATTPEVQSFVDDLVELLG